MTTLRRPRATLYVRLSLAADDSNLSRDGMAADLTALAGQLGADVCALHIDDGLSGSIRNRPEFLAWLADAREGRAEIMLAWSGDRLTREGINAAAMVLDTVEGKDSVTGKVVRPAARFVSFDDRLDSQDGDGFRWRFVIAAEVARGERERIVARNAAAKRRMLESGKHVGQVPFGYALDPERRAALVINPAEAALVREMARRVLDGTPAGQVARWANSTGQPRRKAEWTRGTVVQVITNPANAGEPQRPGAPADREPILTFAEVAELRRRLAPRPTGQRGGQRPPRTSKALLAGLLYCYCCDRPMRSSSGRYVCMTAADGGTCDGAVSITRRIVEDAAESAFLLRWGALAETRCEIILTGAAERDRLERESAALLVEISKAFTPDLGARLAAVQAELAALDEQPAERTARQIATGRTRAEAWAAAIPEDRRDMLTAAYDSIVCYPYGRKPARLEFNERPELDALTVDEFGDVS